MNASGQAGSTTSLGIASHTGMLLCGVAVVVDGSFKAF